MLLPPSFLVFFFFLSFLISVDGFVPRVPSSLFPKQLLSPDPNPNYNKYSNMRTGSTESTALYGIPKLFRWLVDLYPLVLTQSVSDALPGGSRYASFSV